MGITERAKKAVRIFSFPKTLHLFKVGLDLNFHTHFNLFRCYGM